MQTVLLIDDDPGLLDILALTFEDAGYAVQTAGDGQAGLEIQRRKPVHAIVSDVNMPRLDGFALCRALRAAGDDVPLILLTSRDNEIDEALGLELGADDYVSKPMSTRVLLARVRALLRRQTHLVSPELDCIDHRVLPDILSDHRAVTATVRWTRAQPLSDATAE